MATQLDRRSFLKYSAAVGAGTSVALLAACTAEPVNTVPPATGGSLASTTPHADAVAQARDFPWAESTYAEMQSAMDSGAATAVSITRDHLARIAALDWAGPRVNSIIEVNPDAEAIAADLDRERAEGHVRGPLHGIPIVLKDVIATADGMQNTAGSLALVGAKAPRDAGVVTRLRDAGAIILGKSNLSEWNAFRGYPLHGGWSGRAGYGLNPYALSYSTGDSSSGSGAAVSAGFAAGALGLETYGSIVMPSSLTGIVGLKPTSGLVGRSGSIPISFTRDTIGPMARTVTDVALLLNAIAGSDPLDERTQEANGHRPDDYTAFLRPDGLRGARLGVWRRADLWKDHRTAKAFEEMLPVFRDLGAELVDDLQLPRWADAVEQHTDVMFREFREGVRRYLAWVSDTPIRTLSDVIAFNEAHADEELSVHNQGILEWVNRYHWPPPPVYRRSLIGSRRLGREVFDVAMERDRLDAIITPTFFRPWLIDIQGGDPPLGNGAAGLSNAAEYPHLTVPAVSVDGLPVGLSFMARAWEEPKLLRFGYAFEQEVRARRTPRFLTDARGTFVER